MKLSLALFIKKIKSLILKLFYLLEFFLFLRLILKFFGASKTALVVKQIYQGSGFFVSPFDHIFSNIVLSRGYFIETATLAAMFGYAILVYIFLKLF
jgi:hypothetical protein